MSRIYFHTPTETVEVYGSERAYIGQLCAKVAAGVFDMLGWEEQQALLPHDWRERIGSEQLGIDPRTRERFGLFIRASGEDHFADGSKVFTTVLNTVLRIGSDPMGLAARIHGQCEIHGYVEPEDGEFVAALIEQGLQDGVFRPYRPLDGKPTEHKTGWEEAARVLRSGEIVVTSYSVCESFPNEWIADWTAPTCEACDGSGEPNPRMKYTDVDYGYCTTCGGGGKLSDAWYDLPDDEQWRLGVTGLRASAEGLRWGQGDWREFYFGDGRTALDYVTRRVALSEAKSG